MEKLEGYLPDGTRCRVRPCIRQQQSACQQGSKNLCSPTLLWYGCKRPELQESPGMDLLFNPETSRICHGYPQGQKKRLRRKTMSNPKIAVVLSGCGHKDGAEIREAVLALTALDKEN